MARSNDSQFEPGVLNSSSPRRHRVGIDTLSLDEGDAEELSAEAIVESQRMFLEVIKHLDTEREKFIAICLHDGFSKQDIAFMLSVHPSRVTRNTQEMREKLKNFRSKARK